MHNYARKTDNILRLRENKDKQELSYFSDWGIFEANSGCNNHIKSGKIFIETKVSENSRSLCKVLAGSQVNSC